MPTPRASIRPAIRAGALATTDFPRRTSAVWSSATSRAPCSSRRNARSDFPAPEGPRSKAAPQLRPRGRNATQVACTSVVTRTSLAGGGRHANGEAGGQHAAVRSPASGGGERAAVGLHDLPADRQAQPRMLAEMLGRALRVETLEDRFEVVLGDAVAFVVDGDDEGAAARFTAELDHDARAWRAERQRIIDDVAEHLAVAAVMAVRGEGRVGGEPVLDLDARLLRGGDGVVAHHVTQQRVQVSRV